MVGAFKIVALLLVFLQLTQQASISSDFLNPINNKLISHSSYLSPDVNTIDQTEDEFIGIEQQNDVKIASDSSTDTRLKRQVNQDLDVDAEILPNNPNILKYGKSMPIEHHGSGDVDIEGINKLLPEVGFKEGNDTANKVQKIESNEKSNDDEQVHDTSSGQEHHDDIESHGSPHVDLTDSISQEGLLENENEEEEKEEEEGGEGVPVMKELISSQDGTHTNHNNDNSEESSVMSGKSFLATNPMDDGNIEENLLHEESENSELKHADNVVKEDALHGDNVPLSTNDMKEDDAHAYHDDEHDKSTVKSEVDSTTANTPMAVNNPEEKGDKWTEVVGIENKASVHDDTEKGSLSSRLQVLKNETMYSEEGSGDEEDVTVVPHGAIILDENEENDKEIDDAKSEEASADNMDFNIDSETTSDQNQTAENESEEVSPILDPTQDISKDDSNSKASDTDEVVLVPESTENSTNADVSLTYDPKTIVNPFNFDKGLEISESIGRALEIADTKNESKEFEGSGDSVILKDNDNDKDSLEDDDVIKVYPPIFDTDDLNEEDHSEEKKTAELPMISKHHPVLFNPVNIAAINEDGTNGAATESSDRAVIEKEEPTTELPIKTAVDSSTGSHDTGKELPHFPVKPSDDLSLTASVNEEVITNEKIEKESDEAESTSSSSTGSFIVLGAIMATIVLLLCYSVIKSRRQKQRNLRRSQPEENEGTELKEKITLLPDENGHGPGNGNVETGKLLSAKEDGDLKDGDSFPNTNIVRGENGTGNQYKDPNVLTEVKVSAPNAAAQPVVNGGLNSPDSSRRPGEPGSDEKAPLVHGIKPEITKAKMFIDADSIPKTPIVIVKRGPANVEM